MEKTETIQQILPVIPLRNLVLFPGVNMPIELGGRAGSKLAQEIGAARAGQVLLVPRSGDDDDLTGALGVMAEVKHVGRSKDHYVVVVRGVERRVLTGTLQIEPFLTGQVSSVVETGGEGADFDKLVRAVRDSAIKLLQLEEADRALVTAVEAADNPGILADRVAGFAGFTLEQRLGILRELDVTARLTRVQAALEGRFASLEAVEKTRDPNLREKVLRAKMAELQKELGEEPDAGNDDWNAKIEAAGMPPEVEKVARKQLSRLRSTDGQSPESGVARTYLEWLVELPWSKRSDDRLDLAEARRILDEDHAGLGKVKKRVLEYLAVRKLNPGKKGPILLLVGPPGVGKTSLGRSIARTLGRQYVRVALGGVRDEAEIRGHRRTYIGALPGRIIQALRRAGTKNPVFVLDELDKVGRDRGDPAAALLEVLDPEQNYSFSDHYLEVPFDLSEVVFIATANDLGTISGPVRDRMEVIQIPGYTTSEKRDIARGHLVPRQLEEHGLKADDLAIDDGALREIIEGYSREAGVRNLEREIAKVARGVAVNVAVGTSAKTDVTAANVAEYLGPAQFDREEAERDPRPGVATGMAWTPVGGEILFIEATRMPGHGKLVVTGQLGDVMQESAQAALSFVRSHAGELGVDPSFFERSDIHLHVPAGATPKDGPSAGNAIATALVSLVTGRSVRGDVAMTGEITLRGHILPVGGIGSKVLAAHRAGIKRVILPARNAKDLEEIPAEVRAELDIQLVSRLAETLALALAAPAVEPVSVANGNAPLAARAAA